MRWLVVAGALSLGACSDAVGPNGLRLVVLDAQDSVWTGRPGEDTVVRIRVFDGLGAPVSGAFLTWSPIGTGSSVSGATAVSDRDGTATVQWRIGTDASEQQELRFSARGVRTYGTAVIHGRVAPHVVAALRAAVDTPFVLRLGDAVVPQVIAVDPYGNSFPVTDLSLASDDTTVVRAVGVVLSSGSRRGAATVTVASSGQELRIPVQVVQVVTGVEPVLDTVRFTSLGAELAVDYVVRDDRGQIVADTTASIATGDTAVVQVIGGTVRSIGSGETALHLSLGSATATIGVAVKQRVASLRLLRDTIRLEALLDTTTVRAIAQDSLGALIRYPKLRYSISDANVARFAAGRTLEAVMPGAALFTAQDTVTGISASAEVVVRQRIATIDVAPAATRFDAVGDSVGVTVVARDRMGNPVQGAILAYQVDDSTVLALTSGEYVKAMRAGQARVVVLDPETGTVGAALLHVDPVATSLNVVVAFASPVVTLPVGAELPLTCVAYDRNGVAVEQSAVFAGSVRGTVAGAGCGTMVVQRSGYDTLRFALGQATVNVPVIIATRPDSVGVLGAAQPLTDDVSIRFVGEDLANPSILALRPLVQEILEAYGNPTTQLDRARAIRDWVARTAVHPSEFLHANGTTRNGSVLPVGKTWAEVNAVAQAQWDADLAYWTSLSSDGAVMLDRLLGTLDRATGLRADDGMMVHVAGAHYRMRDLESYRYLLCTFQSVIATTLWAADGLHGMILQTLGHDPAAVFIPELGRWVYEDPTFNEEFLLDGAGDPLSPADLLALGTNGTSSRARATKGLGPSYDPEVYQPDQSYTKVFPTGFVIMGSRLYRIPRPNPTAWDGRFGQIDVAALAGTPFDYPIRVTPEQAFPTLGVIVEDLRVEDSVYAVRLASIYPNHQRFERRLPGREWEVAAATEILPVGACRVEYRSVDAIGNASAVVVLDVWAPRAEAFLQASNAPRCM